MPPPMDSADDPQAGLRLERTQIESLNLNAMVSITDHDTIQAPSSAHGSQRKANSCFPGVERALRRAVFPRWIITCPAPMAEMGGDPRRTLRRSPRRPAHEILSALNEKPNVLVIFNHPMWDLYLIGKEKHILVNEFLQKQGQFLHAMELNGLRHWEENREVRHLAEKWNMLLVSGGDRHGVGANANINLTNARALQRVHEIRRERKLLFMPQNASGSTGSCSRRSMPSAIIRVPARFAELDQRVYHPDRNGVVRPL